MRDAGPSAWSSRSRSRCSTPRPISKLARASVPSAVRSASVRANSCCLVRSATWPMRATTSAASLSSRPISGRRMAPVMPWAAFSSDSRVTTNRSNVCGSSACSTLKPGPSRRAESSRFALPFWAAIWRAVAWSRPSRSVARSSASTWAVCSCSMRVRSSAWSAWRLSTSWASVDTSAVVRSSSSATNAKGSVTGISWPSASATRCGSGARGADAASGASSTSGARSGQLAARVSAISPCPIAHISISA